MKRIIIVRIIIVLCLGLMWGPAISQSPRVKEVGFNVSELVGHIIPFKGRTSATGPFAVVWRTGRNNKFFNFQMGARIREVEFGEEDDNYMNLQIGYLKKKRISDKFSYYTSQNLLLSFGGFNIPGEGSSVSGFNDELLPGFSLVGGFQYNIAKHVSLVTETTFAVTIGFGGGLTFIPPLGIFLVGRF